MRYENNNRIFVKIVLDYNIEVKLMKTKRYETYKFENAKSSKEQSSHSCNLYDCIDSFVLKEQLEKGNEWYCNKCKNHVLATK